MATYTVTGINVGTFNLGEADKVLTIFTAERGLIRAVARGSRKPGARIAGRAEPLHVNKLLLAKGRSLDIITQAEGVEAFPELRKDLIRLSYALYYAELTANFGLGLSEEASVYFDFLLSSLRLQAQSVSSAAWLCLCFELALLEMLGYRPELTYCVSCRNPLSDNLLGAFHQDWGGIVCKQCLTSRQSQISPDEYYAGMSMRVAREITPTVWRHLILASDANEESIGLDIRPALKPALGAARRIIQSYIEQKAGRRTKALELATSLGEV